MVWFRCKTCSSSNLLNTGIGMAATSRAIKSCDIQECYVQPKACLKFHATALPFRSKLCKVGTTHIPSFTPAPATQQPKASCFVEMLGEILSDLEEGINSLTDSIHSYRQAKTHNHGKAPQPSSVLSSAQHWKTFQILLATWFANAACIVAASRLHMRAG